MYGLKARTVASSKVTLRSSLPAQRRRHMHPFFFPMGPATLCITCILLVGLTAVLYINQVAQVVAANHQLQEIRNEQAALKRQNQDLADTLAREQSPGYIVEQAQKMGLGPADPKNLWILKVSHVQKMGKANQPIQP
jgi:hypothetical protein